MNISRIKYQLLYFIKEQYAKNLTEVTNTKNAEGLSGADKLEMNMSKMDEGAVIMSEINTETTMARIMKDLNITITDEEIQYYMDNMCQDPFQIKLIRHYFASRFGNYRDLQIVSWRDHIILSLVAKKQLIYEAGYNPNKLHIEECYLPYILTGNMSDRLNNRLIRNANFTTRIDTNADFQYLMTNKYSKLLELKPMELKQLISTFINTPFTYVVYEDKELLGKPIIYDDNAISTELIEFMKAF